MKKFIRLTLLLVTVLWGADYANAAPVLSFDASNADISKQYSMGEAIVMELWISGLTDIDLAGFDLALTFDPLLLGYQSTSFAATLESEDFIMLEDWLFSPGALVLTGVSLAADLSAQMDAFRIATLAFTTLSAGASWLSIDSSLLSDAFAESFTANHFAANISIAQPMVTVSEPSSLLLALGFIVALSLRRSRQL